MPSIAGVTIPLGQQKKSESGSQTDTSGSGNGSTGSTQTTTEPPATPTSPDPVASSPEPSAPTPAPEPAASTPPAPDSTPVSSPSSPQPSYAYAGTVNLVSPMPSSLRALLAQDAAVRATPLGQLAEALRAANSLGPDFATIMAPDAPYRTAAQIVAQASAAMVAQATHSQQSVMAVLKEK